MKTSVAVLISVLAFVAPVKAQSTHSTAVVLSENTSQQQIDAEFKKLRNQRAKAYSGFTCADENLPYDMAAYCFNAETNIRSGQIGASNGGSD